MLNPVLTGRSRPDLVGQRTVGDWVALECKGRASAPNNRAKDKAKEQAKRLVSVNGVAPAFQVGGITYFRNDVLRFFWRDPDPEPLRVKNPIRLTVRADDWRHYYAPAFNLIRSNKAILKRMQREPVLMPVEGADVKIGIHPAVLGLIIESQWEEVRRRSVLARDLPTGVRMEQPPYQADGIAVVAGQSWLRPFEVARGDRLE